MAAGKSTVGHHLARELRWSFIDIDEQIERKFGLHISRIFEELGERTFREAESREVARCSKLSSRVIALGGGALLDPANLRSVRSSGILVHLKISAETVLARAAKQRGKRPLLKGLPKEEALARIRDLLKARQKSYRAANLSINTDELTPPQIVAALLRRKLLVQCCRDSANKIAFPYETHSRRARRP